MAGVPSSSHGSTPTLAAASLSLTSGDLTTTSATFVDATGITLTISTGARRVLCGFTGVMMLTFAGDGYGIDLAIDGTRQGGSGGLVLQAAPATAGYQENFSFTYLSAVLSAASHTFKIQFKSDGTHTTTLFADATSPAVFWVAEQLYTS